VASGRESQKNGVRAFVEGIEVEDLEVEDLEVEDLEVEDGSRWKQISPAFFYRRYLKAVWRCRCKGER